MADANLTRLLVSETLECESCVELGAMYGEQLAGLPHIEKRHGVEIFAPYLDAWLAPGCTFEQGDIREWVTQTQAFWDCVLLIDVLEHLTKPDGMDLVARAREIGSKVIVLTPDGFEPHTPETEREAKMALPFYRGLHEGEVPLNPSQEHVSGWADHELEAQGFAVEKVKIGMVKVCNGKRSVIPSLFGVWHE
jgi:hypothetical protein